MSSDTALKFAIQQAQLQSPDGCTPYVIVNEGSKLINMEHMMDRPHAVCTYLEFTNFDDYMAYVKLHKQPNTMTVWRKRLFGRGMLTTIFDYHERKDGYTYPRWGSHRAACRLKNIQKAAEEFKRTETTPLYQINSKYIKTK
jgi:hypothetical protein